MKKIIAQSLIGGLLFAALPGAVCADPSVAVPPLPRPPQKGTAAETGRVLVLDNERTLTGDIERVGEQYRIKRLLGETWIPASKVLRLCPSLEAAHLYLRSRANLADPDERLRLADWCRQHGLRERAIEEMAEAVRLRPNDERLRRLLSHLEEVQVRAETPPPPTPSPAEQEVTRVEVSSESLGLFASKVQPILMNACTSCHTAGRGGAFQLTRVIGPGLANRRSLEKNLAAVLAQLNGRDPGTSKLLQKAVSIHGPGMTQAPLKSRDATPYRLLEYWVMRTMETTPHLREEAHADATPAARSEASWGEDRDSRPATAPAAAPAPPTPTPTPETVRNSLSPASPAPEAKPAARPAEHDPVDPEGFNREFHPPRKDVPRQQ